MKSYLIFLVALVGCVVALTNSISSCTAASIGTALCSSTTANDAAIGTSIAPHVPNPVTREMLNLADIKLVLSDMDGTLLTSEHTLSPRVVGLINTLFSKGIPFIPATGRSRKSMVDITGTAMVSLYGSDESLVPGVYNQGLQVYGPAGELLYERFLDSDVLSECLALVRELRTDVIAYAGDGIYCGGFIQKTNDILASYGEPSPVIHPPGLDKLQELKNIRPNKLIIIDDEENIQAMRKTIETRLANKATITRAVKGMLEILPLGASKGDGVRRLLEHYNVSPENVMAFGDGENDIEMLRLVKTGVAVENAHPRTKEAAFAHTLANNDDGVAHALAMLVQEPGKP